MATSPARGCGAPDEDSGVSGVMIGRAAMSSPWIFREIKHFLATGELLAAADAGSAVGAHPPALPPDGGRRRQRAARAGQDAFAADGLFARDARGETICANASPTSRRSLRWTRSRPKTSRTPPRARYFPRYDRRTCTRNQIQDRQRETREDQRRSRHETHLAADATRSATRGAARGGDRWRLLRSAVQDGPRRRPGESRHHGGIGRRARGRSTRKARSSSVARCSITATICRRAASK